MTLKNVISITNARNNLFKITDQAKNNGTYFTLTQRGEPKAVIMSADEFDSWRETLDVMRDFPNLDKDIKEAMEDYKRGDFVTLEEILAEEGFVLNPDNEHQDNAISNRHTKKSSERSKKNR